MTATAPFHDAAPAATPRSEEREVDLLVSGLVRVRLAGATPGDRAAVEAQLGPAGPPGEERPDITIRYVAHLAEAEGMRLLGPGQVGVGHGAVVVLRGRYRRPARVRIPMADLGGPCELVCEHGVGRVPHLIAVLNLALLARGGVALHASAVEVDGRAVVATGWAKGGKTEAVLALLARGARLVGDEWLHLRPDGTVAGIREPLRVWDWQLRQLPPTRRAVSRRDRTRLALLGAASATAARRSSRVATALDRQRFVDLDGPLLAPSGVHTEPVTMGPVVLMTSADRDDISAVPTTGTEIADRMVASLAYERTPLRELADAHRFAFPDVPLAALDAAWDQERSTLRARLADRPAVEVLHPYPLDLHRLGQVLTDVIGEAGP